MRKLLVIPLLFLFIDAYSQLDKASAGRFQLGLRSTMSAFGQSGHPGMGSGGQFRVQLSDKINTEWFADYITTDIGGLGKRVDGHIGWSVMFYPLSQTNKLKPYLLAGHCFDYTKVSVNPNEGNSFTSQSKDRWSSAVQMGIGNHFLISDRFDLSLSAQYMSHLGNDIEAVIMTNEASKYLVIRDHKHGMTLEGHLLFTLSLNVYIANLW
jgi:opacity protein-like surface antigen